MYISAVVRPGVHCDSTVANRMLSYPADYGRTRWAAICRPHTSTHSILLSVALQFPKFQVFPRSYTVSKESICGRPEIFSRVGVHHLEADRSLRQLKPNDDKGRRGSQIGVISSCTSTKYVRPDLDNQSKMGWAIPLRVASGSYL